MVVLLTLSPGKRLYNYVCTGYILQTSINLNVEAKFVVTGRALLTDQLGDELENLVLCRLCLVLVANHRDLIVLLRALVRKLDIGVELVANFADDGTATTDDLGVVLRVDSHDQLVALQCLKCDRTRYMLSADVSIAHVA